MSVDGGWYQDFEQPVLEGLCDVVRNFVECPPTRDMYKGLYYNDLDHVFESKIFKNVDTAFYRHLMETPGPYRLKRVSRLTRLLKLTLQDVESAKDAKERKHHMERLIAYNPQADEFIPIYGGKKQVFREGGPKKDWSYFSYSVIVSTPVFAAEFEDGDLVSSAQLYTKEGYSQETIALLLGMTVKQVADIQKSGR